MWTLIEELRAVPPPFHSWMAPLMENMLCDAQTGLTEAVVTGLGRAVLFYGRCSMGDGLPWVGKLAYLTTDPMTIQEGRRAIAQAISDHQVKARGPGHPHVNLPAQQPFWFDPPRSSPPKDASGNGGSNHKPSPHWPSRGQEHNRHWRDQRPQASQFPSPSWTMGS